MTQTNTQTKRVALVGHCGPDSSYLRMAVSSAAAGTKVGMIGDDRDLQSALKDGVDLLLFNRVLDGGFDESDGVSLLRDVKQKHPNVKLIMVSNYADTQREAEAAGAEPGFGKSEIGSDRVRDRIRAALGL